MSDHDTLKQELAQALDEARHYDYDAGFSILSVADALDAIMPIVARLAQERDKLADAIKVQAAAVRRIDAKERAEYVATVTLDSERDMNAQLTEQLARLEQELVDQSLHLKMMQVGRKDAEQERDRAYVVIEAIAWDSLAHEQDLADIEANDAGQAERANRAEAECDALQARIADMVAWLYDLLSTSCGSREGDTATDGALDMAQEVLARLQKDGGQ